MIIFESPLTTFEVDNVRFSRFFTLCYTTACHGFGQSQVAFVVCFRLEPILITAQVSISSTFYMYILQQYFGAKNYWAEM